MGIHDCEFDEIAAVFVYNEQRQLVWTGFLAFIDRVKPIPEINIIYIDGGFVTNNEHPKDVDVIVEYPDFQAMMRLLLVEQPFLRDRNQIKVDYKVDLLPCLPQLPSGVNDLREYFQYLRPEEALRKGLPKGAKKGILRVAIRS